MKTTANITASASIALCAEGQPRVPPARFRVWKAGSNPGDYGDLNFTPAAAARVMAWQASRGVEAVIDIEHNRNRRINPNFDPNEPPVTGGYERLELAGPPEAPELWCVPRWSDCGGEAAEPGTVCCGKHQITSGQRVYASPDFDLDPVTREPTRVIRVSLVGDPGTYGISMLASASATRKTTMDEITQLRAAYAGNMALAGSTDAKIAAAAAAMCEQLKTAASALGINLDEEAAPASDAAPAPSAATAAEAPAPPAPVEDKTKMTNAIASAEQPMTRAELSRFLAEHEERRAISADPRLSNEMRNVVASADLPTARAILKALPPVQAPAGTGGDVGGPVNHTAGAGRGAHLPAMSAAELHMSEHIRESLDVTPENVTAAATALAKDPDGGIAVSLKELVKRHKTRRNPSAQAMRFTP
jgi:hypothetical protein